MGRVSRNLIVRVLCLLLFVGSAFVTSLDPTFSQDSTAPSLSTAAASSQVQQGITHYRSGDYVQAIQWWQQALETYDRLKQDAHAAIVHENLARAYRQTGQTELELQAWTQALLFHRQAPHQTSTSKFHQKTGRLLTEQAQTYSHLGQYRQAIALLCPSQSNTKVCASDSALGIAQTEGDRLGEIAAWGSLGNAYRKQGLYPEALTSLERGLALSKDLEFVEYRAEFLNSLGNVHASLARFNYRRAKSFRDLGYRRQSNNLTQSAQDEDQLGLQYFRESLAIATQDLQKLHSLLNLIPVYYRSDQPDNGLKARQQALHYLNHLPDSRDKVFAAINLVNFWQPEPQIERLFSQTYCPDFHSDQPQKLLNSAVATAQRLGDRRAESFALGELGHLYECQQAYLPSLKLTQQAQWAAEGLNAADSLYLWQWQAGRILRAQGQWDKASDAYEQAIATLKTIRADIVVADRNLRFDFRDTIEPIYRELAQLQLRDDPVLQFASRQNAIAKTLETVDELKLAELQNYFGDDCAITALPSTTVEQISQDQSTAIISTLILGDRTAVILTLPDQSRQIHWLTLPERELRQVVNTYRRGLETFFEPYNVRPAQELYRWLIQPFDAVLANHQIRTIVFVQDGIFRSVPMASLHDGQQFLVQKYAIATTPFFRLSPSQRLDRKNPNALVLGLTEAAKVNGNQYSALTYVQQELASLKALLPQIRPFVNQDFTRDRLQQELKAQTYPIVHIATHAEFGPAPQDTFLVTGNNQVMRMNEFDSLLRSAAQSTNSIDLLTLTACRTAVGDDRAALGLAGVALQAGAKSTVASLWYINDRATAKFVEHFYRALLDSDMSKAEALQKAQLELLNSSQQTSHPAFWAPFLLIGNWV